ncbi:fumarate hydratase subunit beta [Gammaproteobacteria bacterium]
MAVERISEFAVKLNPPIIDQDVRELNIGDHVLITGTIYTARDAAHKRMVDTMDAGGTLPINICGQIIYYVGPTPIRPGRVIGSVGPTTAMRMDPFTPQLLAAGMKVCMGKGNRGPEVQQALKKYTGVYLMAVGGAGAMLSAFVKSIEVVAYEDLGTESIKKLIVENFPAVVMNDCMGRDLLMEGRKQYCDISKLEGYIPSAKIIIAAG